MDWYVVCYIQYFTLTIYNKKSFPKSTDCVKMARGGGDVISLYVENCAVHGPLLWLYYVIKTKCAPHQQRSFQSYYVFRERVDTKVFWENTHVENWTMVNLVD